MGDYEAHKHWPALHSSKMEQSLRNSNDMFAANLQHMIRERKWWRSTKAPPDQKTHTMLNGGCLGVSVSELPYMYSALAVDLQFEGTRVYLQELHTPTFPMYFDLDLKSIDAAQRQPAYQKIMAVLFEVMHKFFPERSEPHLFDTVVCTVYADGQPDLSGVHVYCKNVIVDLDKALQMRYAIVSQLVHDHRSVAWSDIIDVAVYRTGLRMVGSMKLENCPLCKAVTGQADRRCENRCDDKGRVCAFRQYRFYDLLSDAPEEENATWRTSLREWGALLTATSLRTNAGATPGYRVFKGCPSVPASDKPRRFANTLDGNQALMKQVEDVVRRTHKQYSNVDVTRVAIVNQGKAALVYVDGFNSTYCLNIGDYHRSSRVYFYLTPRQGVRIKCTCKKTDDASVMRSHAKPPVPCKAYSSFPAVLDVNVREALFGLTSSRSQMRRPSSSSSLTSGTHSTAQSSFYSTPFTRTPSQCTTPEPQPRFSIDDEIAFCKKSFKK